MKAYNHNTRGLLYHPNWPVEPPKYHSVEWYSKYSESHNFGNPNQEYQKDLNAYQSALEKAIEEAVPFENQLSLEIEILIQTGVIKLVHNILYEFEWREFIEVVNGFAQLKKTVKV